MMDDSHLNEELKEIYHQTSIVRRPISGIVSGYHELPYILVAADNENPSKTIEINGTIHVSPKFIITPQQIRESFGDVFDPETFDQKISGRMFSFAYSNRRNLKVENAKFSITDFEEKPEEHLNRVHDMLQQQENVKTGLIFGPHFKYYPVSLDRFISEILEREFSA
jgi:hypothetical protein